MFDDFGPAARRAIVLSKQHAEYRGHNFHAPEHLLLALLDTHTTTFDATACLALHGTDPTELREELDQILEPGSTADGDTGGDILFNEHMKRVLDSSYGAFVDDDTTVLGPEHLLLGLLRDGRSMAADALLRRGVGVESAAARLRRPAPSATESMDMETTHAARTITFLSTVREARSKRTAEAQPLSTHRSPARPISDTLTEWRRRSADDSIRGRLALARALGIASADLSRSGQAVDALRHAAEATAILRALATSAPDKFSGPWMESQRVLAMRSHRCGRWSEAADLAEQVLRHHHRQPGRHPAAVAEAVREAAEYLLDAGSPERAYMLATEASGLHTDTTHPAARAGVLRTLAECAAATDRGVEALTTARAAFHITRQFGAASPAEYRALHARCVVTFARCIPPGRGAAKAVALLAESVAGFRALSVADPARWLPELADATHQLAVAQLGGGSAPDTARETAEQAVLLFERLADNDPDGMKRKLTAAALTLAGIPG